ncbi:Arginine N-methyltransferase [Fasciola gigantica]|uniref:Protein arginine N-methyltransferase n=1 Tax=Fasciola gigantica TaxID=46835 RepID=A0A504YWY1_FASGI|nr:Arginine N-methyltransferase [Fasciola gigantica]
MGDRALVGLDLLFTSDLVSQYTSALSSGFSFVSFDLFHPKVFVPNCPELTTRHGIPSTRSDLVFQKDGKNITKCLVGKLSHYLDVDTELRWLRNMNEVTLQKQLHWGSHLGLPALSMRLNGPSIVNLARLLTTFIHDEYTPVKLWIIVPMCIDSEAPESHDTPVSEVTTQSGPEHSDSPWHWWMQLSSLASDITDALGVVLQIPKNLPDEPVIARWLSEPVCCLLLCTDVFLTNSKGFPVLPKSHQEVVRRFFKLNVQVLITGACRHDRGYVTYQQYVTWLWKNQSSPDVYELQSKGLEDQLQEPLQPLRDNLSSTTYSIFEMDGYKYTAYEQAIYKALVHRCTRSDPKGDDAKLESTPACQVVMVLGAGRGPLVNATLSASKRADCPVRVYVIEKNPNALYTLQDRMSHEWRGLDVHLICGDMRALDVPEKADIFVSELLGSFGDNELSPECLDGAQPHLKDDGISIPCSYTSYLTPIQSLQFYNETKRMRDPTNPSRTLIAQETPYVVRLRNCQVLCEPQKVFTFVHPKPDLKESNSRYSICTFPIKNEAIVHGLAGYFEAVLFDDVTLSTHPQRHSPQMVSWFPLAIPLDRPQHVRAGEHVTVHLWRVVDSHHVWYEWALTEPRPSRIHNAAGQAYKIAL